MLYENKNSIEKEWNDYLEDVLGMQSEQSIITSKQELRELDERLMNERESDCKKWYFVKCQSFVECMDILLD